MNGDSRSANDAKEYILNMLQQSRPQSNAHTHENRNRNDYRNETRNEGRNETRNDYRNDNAERIEIYQDKVGMVIGRGGSKIRELQETHGVRINIDRNTNQNGMSSVSITGDHEKVQDAIREIKDLCGDGGPPPPQREQETQPEPMDAEPFVQIDWQAAARESVSISFIFIVHFRFSEMFGFYY